LIIIIIIIINWHSSQ